MYDSIEGIISIHAPRVGSDELPFAVLGERGISIHAPRVGSDYINQICDYTETAISIHAPRVGSDLENGGSSRAA